MRVLEAVECDAGWDVARLWAIVRDRGVLLLRLRPRAADSTAFIRLTESLATTFRVHHNPSRVRHNEDGTVQRVDAGDQAIALHVERAYLPGKPELLFLHCVRPAAHGGETLVCDGAALLEALDPDVRQACERARLVWHTTIDEASWSGTWPSAQAVRTWLAEQCITSSSGSSVASRFEHDTLVVDYECPLVERGSIGGRLAFASYLLLREPDGPSATLASGDVVPSSWLAAFERAADRLTARVVWQPGDTLIVDNTRCLHGRRAIMGGDRLILTRMGDARPEIREPLCAAAEADVPRVSPFRRASIPSPTGPPVSSTASQPALACVDHR